MQRLQLARQRRAQTIAKISRFAGGTNGLEWQYDHSVRVERHRLGQGLGLLHLIRLRLAKRRFFRGRFPAAAAEEKHSHGHRRQAKCPGSDRHLVVSSTNANFSDWADLSEADYEESKRDLCETTLDCLEQYVPELREIVEHVEASPPRTFQHYTRHLQGASFGTKFEGLKVSQKLPEQVQGLFHAGSVGIIMSGWLGAVNYGVIVANEVDKLMTPPASASA